MNGLIVNPNIPAGIITSVGVRASPQPTITQLLTVQSIVLTINAGGSQVMCVYIKKILSISYLPIILLVSILLFCPVSRASALEEVTLQLKWMHQFQFAGYYAAVQQGYYRDAGLNVTIVPATPGKDPVQEVINGKADYGVGTSSLLLERNAGKPVVTLAVIFQHSPYILLTKDSTANQTIHSLAGKRLMLEPQSDELVAYLKKEGLPLEKMQMVEHSFNLKDLISGTVDAISGYITTDPDDLDRAGFAYHTYTPRSAGIDFYGDNIFTTESELKNHAARAKAFRDASLKGWSYALQHPDEIIDLILRSYTPPGTRADRAHLKYEAEQVRQLIQPNLVEIGYMHSGRWQHIADTYKDLGLLPNKVDLRKFMYDPHPQKNLTIFYWIASSFMGFALLIIAVRLIITSRNLKVSEKQIREHNKEIELINESLEEQVAERTVDLREANLFSEQIISSAQEGVVVYDRDLLYQVWNPYMERLTNLTAAEVLGSHPLKFFPFMQESGMIERLEKMLIDGIPLASDFPFSLPNTEVSGWTSDISAPLRNAQGDIIGIIATVRDVTEKRLTQQELLDKQKRLEEINAELAAQFEESKALQEELADTLNKLQTNEKNHTTIIQMAMDGYWMTDMQGHLLEVNDAYCRMSGYSEQELLSMTIADLEIIESSADVAAHIEKIMTKGEDFFTSQHRRKDGSIFDVEVIGQYLHIEEGRIVVFTRDITERKQMEKELFHKQMLLEDMNVILEEHLLTEQQKSSELVDLLKRLQHSEDIYHSLVETSQDLIWRCDTEGRYIYLNLAWEHILGYELDEMLGKKHSDFQTDEEAELYRQEFDRLQHGESIEQFETTFNAKSGNSIYLVFNAVYVMDEQDEFAGASGTAHNITRRKQTENKLHESEEKHRILLQESGDAMFALTAEGRYTFVNRAFSEGIGKPTEEIIGKTLWDVFPKAEAEKRFSALSSAFSTGEVVSIEVCIPHADGASYHLTTINPIKDTNGKIYAAICSSKNITELKNSEKRLSEITDRVMEQSRELKLFNELLEQRIYERTQELQASHSRINELSEKSHTVFWEVDAQGLYTYINHVSDLLFGYRPEEMIGRMHFYDLYPEPEREAFKKEAFAVFERMEQLNNIENRKQTKDNRIIWISSNAIPMLGDDGSLLGYRGSDTDITEKKNLSEQLIHSQKMELSLIHI